MAGSEFLPSRPRAGLFWRLRRRSFRALPLLAWGLGAAGVYYLWSERMTTTQVMALAEASTYVVAAPVDGRLQKLSVVVGEPVETGQVVARLEDAALRLRLQRSRHELDRLRAELVRQEALLQSSWHLDMISRDLRRSREVNSLARDVERTRLDRLATRAELEETRIRHRGIADELERQRPLGESGILAGSLLFQLETDAEALAKRIEELGTLLEARDDRFESARRRLEGFLASAEVDPELAPFQLEPLQWRIREQEVALDEIVHEIEECTLTAPGSGIVAEVSSHPGEFVRRGAPLLTIVQPEVPVLTAYVPEPLWRSVGAAPHIRLERPDRPGELFEGRLLGVAPSLVAVPERLRSDPRIEEWAVAVRLAPVGDELPGQAVRVYLRQR